MKKQYIVTNFLMMMLITNSGHAQKSKLAILLPSKKGGDIDVIPIEKKQLTKMLDKQSKLQSSVFNSKLLNTLDTLQHKKEYGVNFWCYSGDTLSAYFDPYAGCFIKAVGIVGRSVQGRTLADGFNLLITELLQENESIAIFSH